MFLCLCNKCSWLVAIHLPICLHLVQYGMHHPWFFTNVKVNSLSIDFVQFKELLEKKQTLKTAIKIVNKSLYYKEDSNITAFSCFVVWVCEYNVLGDARRNGWGWFSSLTVLVKHRFPTQFHLKAIMHSHFSSLHIILYVLRSYIVVLFSLFFVDSFSSFSFASSLYPSGQFWFWAMIYCCRVKESSCVPHRFPYRVLPFFFDLFHSAFFVLRFFFFVLSHAI